MIVDLVHILTTVRHRIQEGNLVPVAKSGNPPACPDPRGTVPTHAGMPVFLHFHHLRSSLGRMVFHRSQHIDDQLTTFLPMLLIIGTGHQTILGRRSRNMPLPSQARRHGPGTGLHHHLREVPQGLKFDHTVFLKLIEFMESHRDLMACRRNIEPGLFKGPRVIAPASDPVQTFGSGTCHDNRVPPFQIR